MADLSHLLLPVSGLDDDDPWGFIPSQHFLDMEESVNLESKYSNHSLDSSDVNVRTESDLFPNSSDASRPSSKEGSKLIEPIMINEIETTKGTNPCVYTSKAFKKHFNTWDLANNSSVFPVANRENDICVDNVLKKLLAEDRPRSSKVSSLLSDHTAAVEESFGVVSPTKTYPPNFKSKPKSKNPDNPNFSTKYVKSSHGQELTQNDKKPRRRNSSERRHSSKSFNSSATKLSETLQNINKNIPNFRSKLSSQSKNNKRVNKLIDTIYRQSNEVVSLLNLGGGVDITCKEPPTEISDETDASTPTTEPSTNVSGENPPNIDNACWKESVNDQEDLLRVINDLKGTFTDLKTQVEEVKSSSSAVSSFTRRHEDRLATENRTLPLVSKFRTSRKAIWCVNASSDGSIWFTIHNENVLNRMSESGAILRSVNLNKKIYDFTVTVSGSLLISLVMDNKVWQIQPDGEPKSFIEFKDMLPCGIHAAASFCIYIGITNAGMPDISEKMSYVAKLTNLGNVIQKFEVDELGNRLFSLPYRIRENINGDLCVVDWIHETHSRLLILHPSGKVKAIYTGFSDEFRAGGITCSPSGNILICDILDDTIHVLNQLCECLMMINSDSGAGLYGPCDLTIDRYTRLWVGGCRGDIQCLKYND